MLLKSKVAKTVATVGSTALIAGTLISWTGAEKLQYVSGAYDRLLGQYTISTNNETSYKGAIGTLKTNLKTAQENKAKLDEEVRDLTAQKTALEEKINKSLEKAEKIDAHLFGGYKEGDIESLVHSLVTNVNNYYSMTLSGAEQVNDLNEKLKEVKKTLETAQADLTKAKERVEELEGQLEAAQQANETLEKNNGTLREQVTHLKEQLKDANDDADELYNHVKEKEEEVKDVKPVSKEDLLEGVSLDSQE